MVWLRDYVRLTNNNAIAKGNFSRSKLLKALILFALQGCIDCGYEVASVGYELNKFTKAELMSLEQNTAWGVGQPAEISQDRILSVYRKMINCILRAFPNKIRKQIKDEL